MASAKFAKSTVNHSHSAIWPTKLVSLPLPTMPAMNPYVVITAPISTMNITGLRTIARGSSLTKL